MERIKICLCAFALCSLSFCASALTREEALRADFRYAPNGLKIYDSGYVDQPYMLILPDGSWFCSFTTSQKHEGASGQHVVAMTSRDRGKTWSTPVDIEPAGGPQASWVTPYLTSYGRIYVFYDYNGEEVNALNGRKIRADMLGWYCYRYSDDFGKTWSERFRLPVRVTDCDKKNDWAGKVQIFWGIDKPVRLGDSFCMAFTKLGRYMLEMGEGWIFKCDNIETEKDPAHLNWQMLPEGGGGIRNPAFGSVQEEHNIVPLSDGSLYCVYRTKLGHMGSSYSRDGGKTWSLPEFAQYADGRRMKNPRACPKLYRASNGKYLLWYHNHSVISFSGYEFRNPAWIAGGVEKDGKILWSQPEIFIYDPEDLSFETGRFSYPDFIDDGENFWVSATQKVRARVHKIPRDFLEKLWAQLGDGEPAEAAESVSYDCRAGKPTELMRFPSLKTGGWSLELWVDAEKMKAGEIIFDAREREYTGLWVQSAGDGALKICYYSNRAYLEFRSDVGSLKQGPNHVVITFDGLARIATAVVNGALSDGGAREGMAFARLSADYAAVDAKTPPLITDAVSSFRLHSRALTVSESVLNYRARRTE